MRLYMADERFSLRSCAAMARICAIVSPDRPILSESPISATGCFYRAHARVVNANPLGVRRTKPRFGSPPRHTLLRGHARHEPHPDGRRASRGQKPPDFRTCRHELTGIKPCPSPRRRCARRAGWSASMRLSDTACLARLARLAQDLKPSPDDDHRDRGTCYEVWETRIEH